MYYFDYASTTKCSEANKKLYFNLLNDIFEHPIGNNKAAKLFNESKKLLLQSLKLNNDYEVIYTSGGTEANNLAIIGFAKSFTTKKHFITTNYEHSSVANTFKYLEKFGHDVTYLNIKSNGEICYTELENSITRNTVMISIMAVNNEIGALNNENKIRAIIEKTKSDIVYMTDAVQAIGKVNYNYAQLDIITLSAHKLYAPKGIGALIIKNNININNILYGGNQQHGIRPGTLDPNLCVVMSYAVKSIIEKMDDNIKVVNNLVQMFVDYVKSQPKLNLNCQPMTNIVSVSINVDALAESVIKMLNDQNIYASTRSACSQKTNKPSSTLLALGLTNEQIDRTIRFSFSHVTTTTEVEFLCQKINEVLNQI